MPRKRSRSQRQKTSPLVWIAAVIVLALAISTLAGRFQARSTTDPRVDDGAVATRIEVLNGSGQAGAGSHLSTALRDEGYHVVDVRNADRFDYPRTMVVARTQDVRAARKVASFLGGAQLVRQRALVDWDVTVVIGRDHNSRL